jgi:hypothetical protein
MTMMRGRENDDARAVENLALSDFEIGPQPQTSAGYSAVMHSAIKSPIAVAIRCPYSGAPKISL